MGRPEPCVLFAQTFVHPILDEFVDEVLFAEPVVVTACEFLEQGASSASSVITLVGSTSPPSFALEVFVQCGGESRFRRLAQPFLYSHSSSNVLEVEAVVTNHLVVRGSYRSLTLVVYGNTAEDLGQFNIEFDLDSSLANLVSSPSEGKLEDLPPALHSTKLMLEESLTAIKSLSLPVGELNISLETEQFLQSVIKIFGAAGNCDAMDKVTNIVVSAVSSYVTTDLGCTAITWNQCKQGDSTACRKELTSIFSEAQSELQELYNILQGDLTSTSVDLLGVAAIDYEAEVASATTDLVPDVFSWYYFFIRKCPTNEFPSLSKNKSVIVGLSLALLLCSGRETCFHFVNAGGMEQLAHVFHDKTHKSTAVMLMLLGVVERATRYAIGCEGFLGWWPREDENVPAGSSEGYSQMVNLLLQKQRHDVSSLATYVLHRLRTYEVASRYESAVLSLLGGSAISGVSNVSLDMLVSAKVQLKKLLKLLKSCGPIEDPAPVAHASRLLILGQTEGLLSYKATINLIAASNCRFSVLDIDPHVLSLLKERGFLPLSVALLSSTILRSEEGHTMNLFAEIASLIQAILLSLLLCRSGSVFLLHHPEVTVALIHSLEGVEYVNEECVPLRYASVLISKGFVCRPQDVGVIIEQHLRVVCAVDRLVTSTPQSEEFLWIMWELCGLSRSDSGRQALLTLGHFPEAILVLMEALRSAKEVEPVSLNSGTSPLNLAIFHSAAELFEVIVTDTTASSMGSWIEHAVELHKALHSSSPGSNRKDAPTRLLEWVDAGVVYQKNGSVGLLRYAAILASGGDAHPTSTSTLASDSMDVENVIGDYVSGSDFQVIENLLGKLVSDKYFEGLPLRDSSIAQLTTTFRILAFISENLSVAGALYEEGAVTLIYVVLVNCKFMLERSSNTYDYLVDEGAECNSTSDLLLERGREQSIVDLMIPCLVLLIILLHRLQEAKEQHRNTKLLNALLRLHREVSPKLAACVADLSSPYPGSALTLGAVCHLLVSAVACWPVFGWTPGLFHCLLGSVEATLPLPVGPKEACSLLSLLGDLFPDEGIWFWKSGMPSLSALRTLAVGTLLGPQKEKQVDWYLQPEHVATLLNRLTPQLTKLADIVLHFAFTALVVVQDMLRVFVIRIACQNLDNADVLLGPIITWISDHVSESSPISDADVFKVYRLLDFIASLLEHPCAKSLLLKKEGFVATLTKALEKCSYASNSEGKTMSESEIPSNRPVTLLTWCLPVFKSVALVCDSQTPQYSRLYANIEKLSVENCSSISYYLLKLCQTLPVGNELLASLIAFKELASCSEGKHAFVSISKHIQCSSFDEFLERGHEHDSALDESDWRKHPPLLYCWRNLLKSIKRKDGLLTYAIEAVGALSLGALCLCVEGKSMNLDGISVIKCLFGFPFNLDGMDQYPEEKVKDVNELIDLLDVMVLEDENLATPNKKVALLQQIKDMVELLLLLLQKPNDSLKLDDISDEVLSLISSDALCHLNDFPPQLMSPSVTMTSIVNNNAGSSFSHTRNGDAEKTEEIFSLGGLSDKFLWDCPDSLSDRLPTSDIPVKKKIASMEAPIRRSRDNPGSESSGLNAFSRGPGPLSAPAGANRVFRYRKPNTSRPASTHVDEYMRERNNDGLSSGSNVVGSVQRGGSTGGRPPSIHVDVFTARQKGQIPIAGTVGEAAPHVRNATPDNEMGQEKVDRSRQLKADLDDDLQEINIVFDGEESESDEKLPFPDPDDNTPPVPVTVEGGSPRSIVEDTDSDANGSTQVSHFGTPSASNGDENPQSEFSSRRSVSREASISSERKFTGTSKDKQSFSGKSDDSKVHLANFSGFPPFYKRPSSSMGDSRMPPPTFYQRDSPQQAPNYPLAAGSQGPYDQKHVPSQPPLPPFPPPPNVSRVTTPNSEIGPSHSSPYGHSMRDIQPPLPPGYPSQLFEVSGPMKAPSYNGREDRSVIANVAGLYTHSGSSSYVELVNDPSSQQLQTDYQSQFNMSSSAQLITPHLTVDSKYSWPSASSSRLHDEMNTPITGSGRPPPLPPTPPPYTASSITHVSAKSSFSQSPGYNQAGVGTAQLPHSSASPLSDARLTSFSTTTGNLTSYSPPQLVSVLPNVRPAVGVFSSPSQQQVHTSAGLLQTASTSQSRLQQLPQPPHPHAHQFRPIQVSVQQTEMALLQSPIQIQGHQFQIPQQPHISPGQVYYPTQQQDHLVHSVQQQQVEHTQPLRQQRDNELQQKLDSGVSIQQYFTSPEAIQSLLNDREKLCQLLEQHPKLMSLLQDRLERMPKD